MKLTSSVLLWQLALATEIEPPQMMPPFVTISVMATVCLEEADLNKIIDAEISKGNGEALYHRMDGCNNFCITGIFIREVRRFRRHSDNQLLAQFEIRGANVDVQTFSIVTAIENSGWPIKVAPELHQLLCEKQNQKIR